MPDGRPTVPGLIGLGVREHLFNTREWAAIAKELGLPPQQTRIVYLVILGLGDKQIAQILGLTKPTVRTHLGRIFTRVGVADRIELVLHILRVWRDARDCQRCPHVR